MFKLRILDDNFSLGKATVIIASLTLASRISGFVLKLLLTRAFGAGDTLDIYLTAFRIPDILFNMLILGTLSAAFIPVFSNFLQKDKAEAWRIANSVLNISILIMGFFTIIGFIFAHPLTHLIVPGFDPEKLNATVSLTRLLLISPILFTISNVFTGILTTYKRFTIVNLAPIFYNIGIIIGLLFLYPHYGLTGLGIGVLLGATMHGFVQLPELLRQGYRWQPIVQWRHNGVRKIFLLMLPRIFGLDASFISLIVVSVIGSYLVAGSISIFNLANDLLAVPVGIFAISVAIAAFPLLSEQNASDNQEGFIATLKQSIEQIIFFAVPITVLILIFRAHIVRLAYGYGQFSWDDTRLTFTTLGVFAFALVSQSLVPLLARTFYARYNTWIPVAVSLCTIVVNAGVSKIMAQHFGVVGLGIGFAAASIFNCIVLSVCLHAKLAQNPTIKGPLLNSLESGVTNAFIKLGLASIPMGLVSYGMLRLIGPAVNTHTILGLLIQSGVAGIAGVLVFLIIGRALGLKQIRSIELMLRSYGAKVLARK